MKMLSLATLQQVSGNGAQAAYDILSTKTISSNKQQFDFQHQRSEEWQCMHFYVFEPWFKSKMSMWLNRFSDKTVWLILAAATLVLVVIPNIIVRSYVTHPYSPKSLLVTRVVANSRNVRRLWRVSITDIVRRQKK